MYLLQEQVKQSYGSSSCIPTGIWHPQKIWHQNFLLPESKRLKYLNALIENTDMYWVREKTGKVNKIRNY